MKIEIATDYSLYRIKVEAEFVSGKAPPMTYSGNVIEYDQYIKRGRGDD